MTKATLIESVLLKVNGGKPTSDTRVRREDIAVLLSAAINYAIVGQYRLHKSETGENEFSDAFISVYNNVPVLEDDDRDLRYIDVPATILALPKNYGLQSVSPMKGNTMFVQTTFTDRHNNSYYSNSFADVTLYWQEGHKVYFQNLPTITDKVLVRVIQDLNDIDDNVPLPVPGGLEIEVLRIMDEWFNGTRQMPADYTPNNNNNLQ